MDAYHAGNVSIVPLIAQFCTTHPASRLVHPLSRKLIPVAIYSALTFPGRITPVNRTAAHFHATSTRIAWISRSWQYLPSRTSTLTKRYASITMADILEKTMMTMKTWLKSRKTCATLSMCRANAEQRHVEVSSTLDFFVASFIHIFFLILEIMFK